jgi:SH3-like domain-containing protein
MADKYKNAPKIINNREIVCTKSFRSNFRKGPSTNFPIAYEILIRGYPLQVIKYVDTWYAVEDFEGTIAWISEINIKKTCGAIIKTWANACLYKAISTSKNYSVIRTRLYYSQFGMPH